MWDLAEAGSGRVPKAVFHQQFLGDLRWWVRADRKIALRILDLIDAVLREPFEGIGKPKPLKYLGKGVLSRRITQEHRLVYVVQGKRMDFLQCRYHY